MGGAILVVQTQHKSLMRLIGFSGKGGYGCLAITQFYLAKLPAQN